MKIKSFVCASVLLISSAYSFAQTPPSMPASAAGNSGNTATRIVLKETSDYSGSSVQTRMPVDSEKYVNGNLVRPTSTDTPQAMGANSSPAPVFTTMDAASQAGINPLATQNVEVTAQSVDTEPYIEKNNVWIDWIRQNKDGIIAGALILLIGLALSYYNKMRTASQLKELDDETDSQQDD